MIQVEHERLERFDERLLGFVRGTRCALLDLVIDTSGAGASALPYLALWAYAAHDAATFDAALRAAEERGQFEDVFDVVDEVKSDTPGIPLSPLCPTWPEGLEELAAALTQRIDHLAAEHPPDFAGVERTWLRFMGADALMHRRPPR